MSPGYPWVAIHLENFMRHPSRHIIASFIVLTAACSGTPARDAGPEPRPASFPMTTQERQSVFGHASAFQVGLDLDCAGCLESLDVSVGTALLEPGVRDGTFCVGTQCGTLTVDLAATTLAASLSLSGAGRGAALSFDITRVTESRVLATVSGTVTERHDDILETFPVHGSAEFMADVTAPTASVEAETWGKGGIWVDFSEPVLLGTATIVVTHDGSPVGIQSETVGDLSDNRTRKVAIMPQGLWPVGELDIAVSAVVDAAGNVASERLRVNSLTQPESSRNQGFEQPSLADWFASGCALSEQLDVLGSGVPRRVAPPEGQRMVACRVGGSLSGHFQPASTERRLRLYLGVASPAGLPSVQSRRVYVTLSTGSAMELHPVLVPDTDDTSEQYSGAYVELPLPDDAASGLWVEISNDRGSHWEGSGDMVVVDDVTLVSFTMDAGE